MAFKNVMPAEVDQVKSRSDVPQFSVLVRFRP
jgi:hypothetical protein